jgi:hypothetical protein
MRRVRGFEGEGGEDNVAGEGGDDIFWGGEGCGGI